MALALAIPLVGLALAARREQRAGSMLRLPPPPPARRLPRVLALVAVLGLLGLAATQPALRTTTTARVRTDAQAFFIVDISRSMMASRTATSPTRLARAKQAALEIRGAIPQVASGIATLTNRVLPDLFPTADQNVFEQTMRKAVAIEQPPPTTSNVLATSLGALGSIETQNFFSPAARKRLVIVLTDGESAAFDPAKVAHDLRVPPGAKLIVVHVWNDTESVFTNGQREQGYHLHPESSQQLTSIQEALGGGHVYSEHGVGAASRAARAALGSGPTKVEGKTERTRTLAPYVALLALLPLLLLLPRIGRGLGSALRLFTAEQLQRAGHASRGLRHRLRSTDEAPA